MGPDGKGKVVDWLVPGPQRVLSVSGGKTQTATIAVQPHARSPRGESTIKLVIADQDRPNDLFAESAPVACEVVARPEVPTPARKLPGWLIPVIVGGVALIVGAIFVVLTLIDRQHMLIVQKMGDGTGVVASTAASAGDAAGIRCGDDCWQEYPSGTKVTLHATPSAGSSFLSWRGACSGTADCSVTLDALVTTTAEFRCPECTADKKHVLIVQKTGDGTGAVASTVASAGDAAGIRCGDDCWQEYPSGAKGDPARDAVGRQYVRGLARCVLRHRRLHADPRCACDGDGGIPAPQVLAHHECLRGRLPRQGLSSRRPRDSSPLPFRVCLQMRNAWVLT